MYKEVTIIYLTRNTNELDKACGKQEYSKDQKYGCVNILFIISHNEEI